MDFDKEFSDIYYECCCAGAAGGANCISSFAPENNKGVVDIHEKDKDLKESKMREGMGVFDMDDDGELGVGKVNITHTIPHEKREYFPTSDVPEDDDVYEDDFGNPITESKMREAFDFEDDDDLGYDDFDYEGEMSDLGDDSEYFGDWYTNVHQDEFDANEDIVADTMPTRTSILNRETDNFRDLENFESDMYYDGKNWYDNYPEPKPIETAIDPKLLGESKVMPRSIRESRALIGGSLESKEKTDYENTLEEHNKKRSYDKTVDSIDQKLTGVDSGAHGKHEWTGELKNE